MNNKIKQSIAVGFFSVMILGWVATGSWALFGSGCQTTGSSEAVPDENVKVLVEAPKEDVPDLISDMTGGSVTTEEARMGLEETQRNNPGVPWTTIVVIYVSSLVSKKALPHILGPALPFIAGLNPIIGMVASLIASTTETNKVRAGKGVLWKKPTTLTAKTK